MSLSSSVEYPFQSAFLRLKRLLNGVYAGTDRAVLCMIYFLHVFAMFSAAKMRSGL